MGNTCSASGNVLRRMIFSVDTDIPKLLATTQQFENSSLRLMDGTGYLVSSIRNYGMELADVRVDGVSVKLTSKQSCLPILLGLKHSLLPYGATQFMKYNPEIEKPMFIKGLSDNEGGRVSEVRRRYQSAREEKAVQRLLKRNPKAKEEHKKSAISKARWDDDGGVTYLGLSQVYWKQFRPSRNEQLLTSTIARNVVNDRKVMFSALVYYLRVNLNRRQFQFITERKLANSYGWSSKANIERLEIFRMLRDEKCVELFDEEPRYAEFPAAPKYIYDCIFHDRVKMGVKDLSNIHTIKDEHLRTTAFNIVFLGSSLARVLTDVLCKNNGVGIFALLKNHCDDVANYKATMLGLAQRLKPKGFSGTVRQIFQEYLMRYFEQNNVAILDIPDFKTLDIQSRRNVWRGYALRLAKLASLDYPILDSQGEAVLDQLKKLDALPLLDNAYGPTSWLFEGD